MRPITEMVDHELRWQPINGQPGEALQAGGNILATLHWREGRTNQPQIESSAGRWLVSRRGWGRKTLLQQATTQETVAVMTGDILSKATLQFADGPVYRWRRRGFWHPHWTWLNQAGEPLVTSQPGARVRVEPAGRVVPELALLIALGRYLEQRSKQGEAVFLATSLPGGM